MKIYVAEAKYAAKLPMKVIDESRAISNVREEVNLSMNQPESVPRQNAPCEQAQVILNQAGSGVYSGGNKRCSLPCTLSNSIAL